MKEWQEKERAEWAAFAAKAAQCELNDAGRFASMDCADIRDQVRTQLHGYLVPNCDCRASEYDSNRAWIMLTWLLMCVCKRDLVALYCWMEGKMHMDSLQMEMKGRKEGEK